jgi:hypothetical protein
MRNILNTIRSIESQISEGKSRDELLAILDAEGDGGAVGEPRFFIDHTMIHDRVTGKHVTCDPDFRDYEINPGETTRINNPDGISNTCALLNNLAAHPARSDVVSDEDVSVVSKMIADKCGNGMREKYEELAKQIAEHFAAIAQEKQS